MRCTWLVCEVASLSIALLKDYATPAVILKAPGRRNAYMWSKTVNYLLKRYTHDDMVHETESEILGYIHTEISAVLEYPRLFCPGHCAVILYTISMCSSTALLRAMENLYFKARSRWSSNEIGNFQ